MFTIALVAALVFLLVILGHESDKPQTARVVEADDEDTKTIRAIVKSRWPQK